MIKSQLHRTYRMRAEDIHVEPCATGKEVSAVGDLQDVGGLHRDLAQHAQAILQDIVQPDALFKRNGDLEPGGV